MQLNKTLFTVLLFTGVIILRANGVPLSSFLLITVSLILIYQVYFSGQVNDSVIIKSIVIAYFLFSVCFLQYYISPNDYFLKLLIAFTWIAISAYFYWKIRISSTLILISILNTFILLSVVLLNPRRFHNLFRPTTYEEYVRARYPLHLDTVADYFIDKYKSVDEISSGELLAKAMRADSLKDFEKAMRFYNKAIDQNPDNAIAYHKRGFLKLNSPELDKYAAFEAIKDFNRAIRLDSNFTQAYFHRSVALGYLGQKGRSYLDRKRVWEAEKDLPEDEFLKRYGSSKKSFLIPFHS